MNLSDTEGLCIVVAEAMAAGLPVVATAVGGIREYGRDGQNMLKLDSPDVTELVAQLDRLMARLAPATAWRNRLLRHAGRVFGHRDAAPQPGHARLADAGPDDEA